MTANCHGISFKIAEKSSKSDINRFGKFMSLSSLSSFDYDEQELNTLFYYYFIIISCDSSEVTTTIATDDPPPKKKKLSKATQLEEKVVPVLSLVALDKEISEYKGCSDSSCFKDCRGGCFGKNFLTKDGDIASDLMKLVLQLFREKTRLLHKEELESFCVDLFRRHCTNLNSVVSSTSTDYKDLYGEHSSSTHCKEAVNQADRFTHDWSVELDQFTLPSVEKKRLQLCRHSFSFLYGLKPNTMKRIAKAMKDLQSSEIKSAKQEKPFDHRSYFGSDYSLNDIQAIFDANGLDVGISEARSGLVRASFSHIDAYLWMENYFYQFEHQPNSKEIHIDATWKVSIYNDYLASISSTNASKISLGQFKELWLALFNIVKIRKVKRVSSKCWTCAYINEIRNKQKGDQVFSIVGYKFTIITLIFSVNRSKRPVNT